MGRSVESRKGTHLTHPPSRSRTSGHHKASGVESKHAKEGLTRPQKSNWERQVGGRRPLYQGMPWVKSKHRAGVAPSLALRWCRMTESGRLEPEPEFPDACG